MLRKLCYQHSLYAIVVIGIGLNSCGSLTSSSTSEASDISENKPFILFPDTGVIHSDWSSSTRLVFHWMTEPGSLHPTNGVEIGKYHLFSLTQSYLSFLDLETLTLKPDLVLEIPEPEEDGLTYHFRLRSDARWDDGSKILASDVIFSYKVVLCPLVNNPELKPYLEYIEDVRSAEPLAFTVKMSAPYLYNEHIHTEIPILQESKYDPEGLLRSFSFVEFKQSDFINRSKTPKLEQWAYTFNASETGTDISQLSGAGAYRVAAWERGRYITLVKKQNHWSNSLSSPQNRHISAPDTIIFLQITDEQAMELEMKKQGIDASTHLSTTLFQKLKENPEINRNYHLGLAPTYSYSFIAFNLKPESTQRTAYFTERSTRRAFAHLFPMAEVIKDIYEGQAAPMVGPVHPLKREFNQGLEVYRESVELAETLLSKSGWHDSDGDGWRDKEIDGRKIKLSPTLAYASTSPVAASIAEYYRDALAPLGIDLKLEPLSPSLLVEQGRNHDFDLLMTAFGGSAAPDDFKQVWHSESWHSRGTNFFGFGDSRSDALIDSIRTTVIEAERIPMIYRFQETIYHETPWIPLVYTYRKVVLHRRWQSGALYFERPHLLLNRLNLRRAS
jgi:peptide/nickel transport system substrate-binding protein